MKKILFFALGLPCFLSAQTSLFSDDFETTSDLAAAGYTLYNDSYTPFGTYAALFPNAWSVISWTNEGENTVASCPSWFTTLNNADRWLITPAVTIPAEATSATLTFKARSHDSPPYDDGFFLKISTTNTQKASFTNILEIPHATSDNMLMQTPYTVDLTAYKGSTVYLAWVNNYLNGNLLSVDDIEVIAQGDLAVSNVQAKNAAVVYPNPAVSEFKIQLNALSAEIMVSDASGKTVKKYESLQDSYDISSLKPGVYFITIKTSTGTQTQKLIKK
ncbi:MAG: choice-of-anchor J domain-containing protein [Bergeyella sp.]